MADNDFEIESLGRVYAQALVNLAVRDNVLAEVTEDVRGLAELMKQNAPFVAFVGAATIDDGEKVRSLGKIFEGRVHRLVLETLKAMAHRQRLIFMPGVFVAFEHILRQLRGEIDVELVSASALSPDVVERIRAGVAKAIGKEPTLITRVDPSLIGGIVLRIGDTQIDGSVETQLDRMKEMLKREGTGHLQGKTAAIVG